MSLSFGRSLVVISLIALARTSADAQVGPAPGPDPAAAAPATSSPPAAGDTADSTPSPATMAPTGGLSDSDRRSLGIALNAARRGDGASAQSAMALLHDPVARKLALWACIDSTGEQLSFQQLDQARRDLANWPRPARRQQAAEKEIEASAIGPAAVIAWFGGAEPVSPQGAMALAAAEQQAGQAAAAKALIGRWWRNHEFEAEIQHTMLSRFGDLLTVEDHIKRSDTLLYGPQGPASHDLLPLLPPDYRALAEARMALRADSSHAPGLVAALPASVADDPGLAVEQARYLHDRGLDQDGLALVARFPLDAPNEDAATRTWKVRRQMINAALRIGDYKLAFQAAAHTGLTMGEDFTASQFYAGWIALSKLHDPATADQYFGEIQRIGVSPISQARALYWRGRAAEALGEDDVATAFYRAGGRYQTTFYGQLAAERAGETTLTLGRDPLPSAADRARFESRDLVRAARMLGDLGERDMFRIFILSIDETLPSATESALLVDLAHAYGDQELAMRVVRSAAQHGHILPERGYPLRSAPNSPEAPEAAIVFGITRQESGFDPHVRSGAGARGMMQLMPETAHAVARRNGERFSSAMLDEPDYNMRLGASYLGHMIGDFSGSYVMAAAAYNAGPGRPADWISYCGDPRTSSTDPVDFVECIPFSETRNYVMRVLEATEVYRARMNNGVAPLTLSSDLKRGAYSYVAQAPEAVAPAATTPEATR